MAFLRPCPCSLRDLIPHVKVPDKEAGLVVELLKMVQGVHIMPQGLSAVRAAAVVLKIGVERLRKAYVVPDGLLGNFHIPERKLSRSGHFGFPPVFLPLVYRGDPTLSTVFPKFLWISRLDLERLAGLEPAFIGGTNALTCEFSRLF